eukprot:TRINITY_DN4546_c0_g2_i1.p1 TRINITY_DN4546_c0_g2~~TRINITY_DN4546_c0_g2_i1.p1  ORF type:complete len:618 (-),score=75.75 TRINITY_DN4546_c0_g2_i1:71-1924(-)
MWALLLFANVAVSFASDVQRPTACYRRSQNRTELLTSPRMHEVLATAELPTELDWRSKDGMDWTTATRNQHIPHYCGSCYVFSSTSTFADRVRIARGKGSDREIIISPQVVLNCDLYDLGCEGGDTFTLFRWAKEAGGFPEETCQSYEALGHDTGNLCTPMHVCKKCTADGQCSAQEEFEVFEVDSYGSVKGEAQMLAELQRGPIACAVSTPDFFSAYSGYHVLKDPDFRKSPIDHIISVVGYGTEDGVPYWIVRNSWGTYWGHYGWARVERGKNAFWIEQECTWVLPANMGQGKKINSSSFNYPKSTVLVPSPAPAPPAPAPPCRVPMSDWDAVGGERVETPRPSGSDEVPLHWNWKNVSGTSYATWDTNERIPKFCASCWAHGVTSALGDRIAVMRHGAWPRINLAPQVLINCQAGGSCSGGDPAGAYAYISRHGITDATCQNYMAEDGVCSAEGRCMNCAPGNVEHKLVWPGKCGSVVDPIVFHVSEYGSVRGALNMKAEIFARGPISCGLEATAGFVGYTGGIYSENLLLPVLSHQVGLSGWSSAGPDEDVPEGVLYWIGRNSWGTYWGEGGWFRIQMYERNLGVELDCSWGVPVARTSVGSTKAKTYDVLYM